MNIWMPSLESWEELPIDLMSQALTELFSLRRLVFDFRKSSSVTTGLYLGYSLFSSYNTSYMLSLNAGPLNISVFLLFIEAWSILFYILLGELGRSYCYVY